MRRTAQRDLASAGVPRPVVLAVVALQLGLPLAMLADRWADEGLRPRTERPASWQMYSQSEPPRYTGVDAAGTERPLDLAAVPLLLRAVGTGDAVPARLCAAHPDLVAVRRAGGPDPVLRRC